MEIENQLFSTITRKKIVGNKYGNSNPPGLLEGSSL
jgi:hypothetical protein